MENNQFVPARGFNALAAQGRRIQKPGTTQWLPVFDVEENAIAFARYVGGFARRVVTGCTTRASTEWWDMHGGLRALLSVQFPGWGREEGLIICEGDQVLGIAIRHGKRHVLLPIKQHLYTARTPSGSLYIGYQDGTAFCRSRSDGPQEMAKAIYFARSETDADFVKKHGGELEVLEQPKEGCVPLYVIGSLPRKGGRGLVFDRETYRLGTKIESVTPA